MDEITWKDLSATSQYKIWRGYKAINAALNYLAYRGVTKEMFKDEIALLEQAREGLVNKTGEEELH